MALEKAIIKRYIPDGETIAVLFNPNEYRLGKSNQFTEVGVPGLAAPLEAGSTFELTLSFEKAGEVQVRALFGAISRGTERLVHAGRVPANRRRLAGMLA